MLLACGPVPRPAWGSSSRRVRNERYTLRIGGPELEETLHDLQGRHDDGPALTGLSATEEEARNRLRRVMEHHLATFER